MISTFFFNLLHLLFVLFLLGPRLPHLLLKELLLKRQQLLLQVLVLVVRLHQTLALTQLVVSLILPPLIEAVPLSLGSGYHPVSPFLLLFCIGCLPLGSLNVPHELRVVWLLAQLLFLLLAPLSLLLPCLKIVGMHLHFFFPRLN